MKVEDYDYDITWKYSIECEGDVCLYRYDYSWLSDIPSWLAGRIDNDNDNMTINSDLSLTII